MSSIAIKVEDLSKLYKIGARQEGYKTLRESVTGALTAPFHLLVQRAKSKVSSPLLSALCALSTTSGLSKTRFFQIRARNILQEHPGWKGKDMTDDRKVREIILKMADKILKEYQPKMIILFGSYAYGEPTEDSDVDLLIIKDTEKRPIDRWIEVKRLLRGITPTLPVSPLVYTSKEIEERTAIKDFFIEEILQKGEVLHGWCLQEAVHIRQAIEKYLKGYLVLHGKKPPKIHELDTLLNRIGTFDDSFIDFLDLCEKASQYYIEARYPPGPPVEYEYEEIKEDLDRAWELIKKIQVEA